MLSAHSARQEKRRRGQYALQIQVVQILRIAHPVIQHHLAAGTLHQLPERHDEDKHVIDLTDHLRGYLDKKIPVRNLVLSYVYWIPDSMFMVLPAAVLFATVFAIGAFTRHAEVTAAKASGISFYRMVMPIFFASIIACGLDIGLGEIAPRTNKRRSELLNEDNTGTGGFRFNFVYSGVFGSGMPLGT